MLSISFLLQELPQPGASGHVLQVQTFFLNCILPLYLTPYLCHVIQFFCSVSYNFPYLCFFSIPQTVIFTSKHIQIPLQLFI